MNAAGSYDRDRALRQFTIEGCEGNAFSGDGHNGLRRFEERVVPLRISPAQGSALNGEKAMTTLLWPGKSHSFSFLSFSRWLFNSKSGARSPTSGIVESLRIFLSCKSGSS